MRLCPSSSSARDKDDKQRTLAVRGAPPAGLIRAPGLADSRLAAQQEQMAMTRGRVGQTRTQLGELALAPHEQASRPRFGLCT